MTHTMSDVEILQKKQQEITKARMVQAIMAIIIVALSGVIATIAILSRFHPPSPTPTIDVLVRHQYEGGHTIQFPDEVTAGEPFQYETKGKKLVNNGADVRFQLDCAINGSRQITPLGEIYSNVPAGEFDLKRTTTIPVSTRLQNSDDCRYQSIATYTFYQIDNAGNERSFIVVEAGKSNRFKLTVPQDDDKISVVTRTTVVQSTPVVKPDTDDVVEQEPVDEPPMQQPDPQPQQNKGLLDGLLDLVGL